MMFARCQEAIDRYRRSEGYTTDEVRLPSNATLRRLWKLFEYPETSRAGFVVALLSVTITLVSIVLFCVETLPAFATTHCVKDEAPNFIDPFFIIETTCTAWFTVQIRGYLVALKIIKPVSIHRSVWTETLMLCSFQRRMA